MNDYSGDNEDLYFSGPFIRNNLDPGVAYARYNSYDLIYGYKRYLIMSLTGCQIDEETNSINAFYDFLFNDQGSQRPATPTYVTVDGSTEARLLNWNDNTCPDVVEYENIRWGSNDEWDLFENNEDGFRIYRKAMGSGEEWDCTINNYNLIHTTNQDVTSYLDNTPLQPGRYSYVVVAFNQDGNSIPKAQITVDCSSLSRVDNITFEDHVVDNFEFHSARYNITAGAPYTFNIPQNAEATFCAGEEIVLKPGFTSENGSEFAAKIETCEPCAEESPPLEKAAIAKNIYDSHSVDNTIKILSIIPNPSKSKTIVNYTQRKRDNVHLYITNILGEHINSLIFNSNNNKAVQSIEFDVSKIPSGLYLFNFTVWKLLCY